MSAGPSLYRRHRPRTFADVVGQEHVVRTLRNAVERDKVHHAYLFVGSRGTGKTSMAKILAACLNCEHGPTTEPCGKCPSCVAIHNATSLDVIEMDAASNNSVDDIRDLREKVGFAPVSGRSKVYILDEAHMLSTAAWNAFLKTLEEPPPHTIFVLCTTEAQKVLPTVVDRCHRFDFHRPGADQIATVLRTVADRETIDIPDAALALIARGATGSFRDALGTLEQLVTYSGEAIALDDVLAVLGVVGGDLLFDAMEAIAAGDARAALEASARLVRSGRDPGVIFRDLEAHARELLIVQVLGEVPRELLLTPERDERLAEQAQRLGRADVVRLLDLIAAGLEAMANGAEPRIQLELALVKAAAPDVDPSTPALLARIDRLERGGSAAPPPPPAPPPTRAPEPEPAPARAAEPAQEPTPVAAPTRAAEPATLDLEGVKALWPTVVQTVAAGNGMLAAALAESHPVAVDAGELVVAFAPDQAFHKRMAERDGNRVEASEALRTVLGQPIRLAYELREDLAPAAEPQTLEGDELVRRFVAEFDAEEIEEEAEKT